MIIPEFQFDVNKKGGNCADFTKNLLIFEANARAVGKFC